MSTGLIIALIVIVAVVVVVAAVLAARARNRPGGQNLKRRFGPEYDRTVARHDGDAKAAERELAARVERHGDLRVRPLEPAERERFEARWAAVQEHFVDSPREAVTEADALVADIAGALGFPDGGQYEEQLAALSVHHGHHVHGYRRIHHAAHTAGQDGTGGGTEELRAALLEARELFDELLGAGHGDKNRQRAAIGAAPTRADAAAHADDGRTRTDH
ncbi:hypothetical protein [Streptomyces sennicomposti]|uniref:hypothetical protein n=1 Tax=Streptomyces sennicomposti TaxID=2873384 RepID=UPI001CA62FAA|nr:hypothetical protein [Streptomyces sennicomposti]MBY8869507.1 hypothetical protein [Streptomyces sennicomposti]